MDDRVVFVKSKFDIDCRRKDHHESCMVMILNKYLLEHPEDQPTTLIKLDGKPNGLSSFLILPKSDEETVFTPEDFEMGFWGSYCSESSVWLNKVVEVLLGDSYEQSEFERKKKDIKEVTNYLGGVLVGKHGDVEAYIKKTVVASGKSADINEIVVGEIINGTFSSSYDVNGMDIKKPLFNTENNDYFIHIFLIKDLIGVCNTTLIAVAEPLEIKEEVEEDVRV